MKKLVIFLNNLKIKHKVLLGMLVITTFALLLVSFLSYHYFSNRFENQARNNAKDTLAIASNSFNSQFDSVLSASSRFLAKKELTKTLRDIAEGNTHDYVYNYIALDTSFTNLVQSNALINSAFLIDKNSKFYSYSELGINYDVHNYFNWDLSQMDGITFLSARESPISRGISVIPMLIPISYESRMDIGFITGNPSTSTAILVILLDTNKINQYFYHINNNKGSILYLANSNGYPLSLKPGTFSHTLASNSVLVYNLQSIQDSRVFDESIQDNTYLISCNNINIKDLKVVSIILKKDLLSGLTAIKIFVLVSWLICSFVAVLLSIILSKFITNPIHKLVTIVELIQDGQYSEKILPKYCDEVGMLNHSINNMYDTIQNQILIIKEDAEAKAAAEISLLSNQINPHFLYNTLECIHFEILSNHLEQAASMVESLGQFLRIGLNYGSNLISIHSELTHAEKYINLMNHMSNQKIVFRSRIAPELNNYSILKLILQPLIENCIKHGFYQNGIRHNIFNPFIEVDIALVLDMVKITVTDNGIGINIAKAKAALYEIPVSNASHIGLNNVYRRLRTYYGERVCISFLSVPMCQNSVIIELPYHI